MSKVIGYIVFSFLLAFSGELRAQLTTSNAKSPEELVQDVLAGEGVQVFNVQYRGYNKQRGEFWGPSNIGLDYGVIISTGTILNEKDGDTQKGPMGPNNNNGGISTAFTPIIRDQDLADLANRPLNQTFDVAALEFDFIPEGDSIIFRYVFASEEYPFDFLSNNGLAINDVFGFFISGPGIIGTQNIALLDDGATVVSPVTVNANTNSEYYIDNGDGFPNTPQFTNPFVTNFDGFTIVMTAKAKVIPCETYRLKLAVCDIRDEKFDTGVFLEANSLRSQPRYSLENSNPDPSANPLFASCVDGELKITRTERLQENLIVPFTIEGDAQLNTDYTLNYVNTITLNAGESVKTLIISPINHAGLTEDKLVTLVFDNPLVCSSEQEIKFNYLIKPLPILQGLTTQQPQTCPGEAVEITAEITGGVPDYIFTWSHTASNSNKVSVNPLVTTNYNFSIQDACGQMDNGTVEVAPAVHSNLNLTLPNDTHLICKGETLEISPIITGGSGNLTYQWSTGANTPLLNYQVLQSSTLNLTIEDECSNTQDAQMTITLNYPNFETFAGNERFLCKGEVLNISGEANGGRPSPDINAPYKYFWNGIAGNEFNQTMLQSQWLVLEAYDSCNIIPAIDSVKVNVNSPTANFFLATTNPEANQRINFTNTSLNGSIYYWETEDGQTSFIDNANFIFGDDGVFEVKLIVSDDNNCMDTIIKSITIKPPVYLFFPNSFNPNSRMQENRIYKPKGVGITEFEMLIFDRWGTVIFETQQFEDGWDGRLPSGMDAPIGIYVVRYFAKGENNELQGFGQIVLTR